MKHCWCRTCYVFPVLYISVAHGIQSNSSRSHYVGLHVNKNACILDLLLSLLFKLCCQWWSYTTTLFLETVCPHSFLVHVHCRRWDDRLEKSYNFDKVIYNVSNKYYIITILICYLPLKVANFAEIENLISLILLNILPWLIIYFLFIN